MKVAKGINVRPKGPKHYGVFLNHGGLRFAFQYETEDQAIAVARAFLEAKKGGRLDAMISGMRKQQPVSETAPVEKPSVLILREYYEKIVQPLWEGSLSRNTFKSYDGSFRVHILPSLGDLAITDITRDRVKRFVTDLRKKSISSNAETGEPRLLAKETIRNIAAALRACFTEAVEAGLLVANPAVRLGKFYKEAADFREEIDPFTAEDVSTLLQTTREHFGFENYVLLLTLFHCGLRAGEAAGLYWSDLDVKNKILLVRRQITRGKKGKPKTRKRRAVDVSTVLLKELEELKKTRKAEYLSRGKNEIPEFIFLAPGQIVWKDGEPVGHDERNHVDMDNFRNRVFWKVCDKAKIRRRRVHDTRHTFASLLLSNGEPLKYVSAQLGHSSIRMTADVYGHLEIGSNRGAVDRLPVVTPA